MVSTPSALFLFTAQPAPESDTDVCAVIAKSNGVEVGQIRWYVTFRSYTFFAAAGATFTHRALADIEVQLVSMADEWARVNGKKPRHGKPALGTRCAAVKPGDYQDARNPAKMLPLTRCGRMKGHDGQHKALGSNEAWEA